MYPFFSQSVMKVKKESQRVMDEDMLFFQVAVSRVDDLQPLISCRDQMDWSLERCATCVQSVAEAERAARR